MFFKLARHLAEAASRKANIVISVHVLLKCSPFLIWDCAIGSFDHENAMQVWGSKTIRLYAPEQSQSLYPFANPFLRNTSQVFTPSQDPTTLCVQQ